MSNIKVKIGDRIKTIALGRIIHDQFISEFKEAFKLDIDTSKEIFNSVRIAESGSRTSLVFSIIKDGKTQEFNPICGELIWVPLSKALKEHDENPRRYVSAGVKVADDERRGLPRPSEDRERPRSAAQQQSFVGDCSYSASSIVSSDCKAM